MEVGVFETSEGFSPEARRVDVGDVVATAVEGVEEVEREFPIAVLPAYAGVERGRGGLGDGVVFGERLGAEGAEADAGEGAGGVADDEAGGDDGANGVGDAVSGGTGAIACVRERYVGVESEPRGGAVEIGELDAIAARGATGLGAAGIADEDEFGIEVERPERDGAHEAGSERSAQPAFETARANEGVHTIDGRCAVGGVNADGGAAGVVAVEAEAGVEIKFSFNPRAEHEA